MRVAKSPGRYPGSGSDSSPPWEVFLPSGGVGRNLSGGAAQGKYNNYDIGEFSVRDGCSSEFVDLLVGFFVFS